MATSPYTASAARNSTTADANPVIITRHRKPRFVLMSVERYAAMAGSGETQQAHTLDDMPAELKAAMVAALERDLAAGGMVHKNRQG